MIYQGRTEDMDPYKGRFAADTPARTLAEALVGADVFVGLSVGGVVDQEMVRSMARDPIVFALANPDPEIGYEDVRGRPRRTPSWPPAAATTRTRSTTSSASPSSSAARSTCGRPTINEAMKLAAVKALAELAREDVPDAVLRAYGLESLRFGREYLIPKPFDYRGAAAGRRRRWRGRPWRPGWRGSRSPTSRPTSGGWRR